MFSNPIPTCYSHFLETMAKKPFEGSNFFAVKSTECWFCEAKPVAKELAIRAESTQIPVRPTKIDIGVLAKEYLQTDRSLTVPQFVERKIGYSSGNYTKRVRALVILLEPGFVEPKRQIYNPRSGGPKKHIDWAGLAKLYNISDLPISNKNTSDFLKEKLGYKPSSRQNRQLLYEIGKLKGASWAQIAPGQPALERKEVPSLRAHPQGDFWLGIAKEFQELGDVQSASFFLRRKLDRDIKKEDYDIFNVALREVQNASTSEVAKKTKESLEGLAGRV